MAAIEQPETRDGEKTMLCGAWEASACCVAQVGFELCRARESLKCCVAAGLGVSRDISGFELSRGVTVGWFDRRTEWCGNCMITAR